ncbi:MAG: hypothetical protein R2729_00915 [Bryobacteraceae bacterium]
MTSQDDTPRHESDEFEVMIQGTPDVTALTEERARRLALERATAETDDKSTFAGHEDATGYRHTFDEVLGVPGDTDSD